MPIVIQPCWRGRNNFKASYRDATRVIAAMPYHWSTLGNGSGMRQQGGKELVQARAAWETIGRAVVAAEREANAIQV